MGPLSLMVAALLGIAAPASQNVDWRQAGGGLFATPAPEPTIAEAGDGTLVPRLATLNQPFQDAVDAAARAHGLEPTLLHALIITESGYRPDARSSAGAVGLTQLMPETALELGITDRLDPVENLRGGADYLARQILRFGNLRLALAAYNSGPSRVARLGRVPEISETQAFVATVIDCYLALTEGRRVVDPGQCRSRETVR